MTKTQETQIALHEQRITAIEVYHKTVDKKLDIILEKMDNQFVTQRNYEQDLKRFLKTDIEIETRLTQIEKNMVTQEQMKYYQRSQFWQKVMTFLGGVGVSIITAVLLYEVSKLIEK